MSSGTLRRRLDHGGRYDTSRIRPLNEPLLELTEHDYNPTEGQELVGDARMMEHLHWSLLFSNLIAEWAQWLANIMVASGALFGWVLPFNTQDNNNLPPVFLTPVQEEWLQHLKERLSIPFDGTFAEHQDALKQLWRLSYPDRHLPSLKSEVWKEMGWQGTDPSTDFRGGGFISLENLIFFARTYPVAFQNLLHKRDGNRSEWEYPFAVAGINVSFMLVQMLDLQSGNPRTIAGLRFLDLLKEDEMAFDHLFCVAFKLLDAKWLARRASYMEFNDVLKSTRLQLEYEMALEEVWSVRDLPAYMLLRRRG